MLLDFLVQKDDKPLYARDGWIIPTVIEEPPVTEIGMRKISEDYLNRLPQGNKIRSYSMYPYNCVGMIFAARRKWIEIDHIYEIFEHDGYRQIKKEDAVVGDVVLYKKGLEVTHVALIIQIERVGTQMNIKTLSKWGALAEFEHFLEDVLVDLVGHPVEYWTERQL
jgi:hypothetical protein